MEEVREESAVSINALAAPTVITTATGHSHTEEGLLFTTVVLAYTDPSLSDLTFIKIYSPQTP